VPTELPEQPTTKTRNTTPSDRLESAWSSGGKDLLDGRHTVGERELQVLRQKLLDVGTADVGGLLNLDYLQDLFAQYISIYVVPGV